jgi:hypothetical protein
MNIFFLSWCVTTCAEQHFDKHVIKMIVELAQLLSTAHWQLNPEYKNKRRVNKQLIYKQSHVNHPSAKWVRAHINNYRYTVALGKALCEEYYVRYGVDKHKRHATEEKIHFLGRHEPHGFPALDESIDLVGPYQVTEPPQAMPDECKVDGDVITAYRRYYQSDAKSHLAMWKRRERPEWFE